MKNLFVLLLFVILLSCCDKKNESTSAVVQNESASPQQETSERAADYSASAPASSAPASSTPPPTVYVSAGYPFEQNFLEKDVSIVIDDEPMAAMSRYAPNIGFTTGKIIIYNGSIALLNTSFPDTALAALDKAELRLLRNAIYAQHGMIFQSNDLTTHFRQFTWYNPTSSNVEAKLTDIDKKNIRRIQLFENAQPYSGLNARALAGTYYEVIPMPSWSPEIKVSMDNSIEYFRGGEDNFSGSFRIENGFLAVLVTSQYVGRADYFLNNDWLWPNGASYSEGTVVYREPIKLVFPVVDTIYSEYHDQGRQIGSVVWAAFLLDE
jgi:hypothetical protein